MSFSRRRGRHRSCRSLAGRTPPPLSSDSPSAMRSRADYLHEFEDNEADETPVVTDEVATCKSCNLSADESAELQMQTSDKLTTFLTGGASTQLLSLVCPLLLGRFCQSQRPALPVNGRSAISIAGSTVSQRRTALDSENVADILFVHSNA